MPALIVIVLVLALTAGGGSGADESSATPAAASAKRADRFDSERGWSHLEHQVGIGPRPAGSPQLAELANYIRERIPRGRTEPVPGHPGLRNVVGRIPGSKPAIVLAAHYDTKDLPGFVGANDGAGGTAAVIEIARALRKAKRPKGAPEIRFVFFDGEEATDDTQPFVATALRGSEDVEAPAGSGPARRHRALVPARRGGRGHRRPHAVPAPRDPGDRPDRLHVPLLARDLRRPLGRLRGLAGHLRGDRVRDAQGLALARRY